MIHVGTQTNRYIEWLQGDGDMEYDTRIENQRAVLYFYHTKVSAVVIKLQYGDEIQKCRQDGYHVRFFRIKEETHQQRMEDLFAGKACFLYDHSEFSHHRQLLLHFSHDDRPVGFDVLQICHPMKAPAATSDA